MVVYSQGICSPHTVWSIDIHWCYCRTLQDDWVLGTDSIGCRIFMVLGFDLIHDGTSHCLSPTCKMNQNTNPLEASVRKVRLIEDAVPLAIFSWNDWEVPEQRQSAGVCWKKARPSTDHPLASDFQGGGAEQNSIMLQVFEAKIPTFRTNKVVSSIRQWEGKGEQNFLRASSSNQLD